MPRNIISERSHLTTLIFFISLKTMSKQLLLQLTSTYTQYTCCATRRILSAYEWHAHGDQPHSIQQIPTFVLKNIHANYALSETSSLFVLTFDLYISNRKQQNRLANLFFILFSVHFLYSHFGFYLVIFYLSGVMLQLYSFI